MTVDSINIGSPRPTTVGSVGVTGIYKLPVDGRARITIDGVSGDAICDSSCHGGLDQAVYVYTMPDYEWWQTEHNVDIAPGLFGENLTVTGFSSVDVHIGDRLHFAEVILEITAPRIPCSTLAAKMEEPTFVKRFRQAARPGFYCRVIAEGSMVSGEALEHSRSISDGVRILEIFEDYYDKSADRKTIERFLASPLAIRSRTKLEDRLAAMATAG